MNFKPPIVFILCFCCVNLLYTQDTTDQSIPNTVQKMNLLQVGDTTGELPVSVALEIKSTDKGLLLPRLTLEQINDVIDPAIGLIVYCSDCVPRAIYVYTALGWETAYQPAVEGNEFEIGDINVLGTFIEGRPFSYVEDNPPRVSVAFTNTTPNDIFFTPQSNELQMNNPSGLSIVIENPVAETGDGQAVLIDADTALYSLPPNSSTFINFNLIGTTPTFPVTGTLDDIIFTYTYSNDNEVTSQATLKLSLSNMFDYQGVDTNNRSLYNGCSLNPNNIDNFSNFTIQSPTGGSPTGSTTLVTLDTDNGILSTSNNDSTERPDGINGNSFLVAASYNNSTYKFGQLLYGPFDSHFVYDNSGIHSLETDLEIDQVVMHVIGSGGAGGGSVSTSSGTPIRGSGGGGAGAGEITINRLDANTAPSQDAISSWPHGQDAYRFSIATTRGGITGGNGQGNFDSVIFEGLSSTNHLITASGGEGGKVGTSASSSGENEMALGGLGRDHRDPADANDTSLEVPGVLVQLEDGQDSQEGAGGNAASTSLLVGGAGAPAVTAPNSDGNRSGSSAKGAGGSGGWANEGDTTGKKGGSGERGQVIFVYTCPTE